MTAQVHVAAAGSRYPDDQKLYDQQVREEVRGLLKDGDGFLKVGRKPGPLHVTAGAGDGIIDTLRFQPGFQTIKVGQTVTWTNLGSGAPHTITFGEEPGDPTFKVTFNTSGDFPYICAQHDDLGMIGVIKVRK